MNLQHRATLKNIREDDLQRILEWRNQRFIREVMFNDRKISCAQHIQWFNKMVNSETFISKMFYFDNIPYGVLNVNKIDYTHGTCEWGFYIGTESTPRGLGSVLGYVSLDFIFNILKLRKLSAEVLSINERSINFHEKMGFKQEGILREQLIRNGQIIDVHLFGYLASDWANNEPVIHNYIERSYEL
ncbi:UDP-4-amino-4,6-dideoxy-N-acetyl-beta-L-altrosamine N-acetyltransferase [Sporosarcina cascadiensis]|uniref:UDP-4-amino-4, 6-dideoxy-N-acetyl-beta-L-altrosamine N-acetyltransferase n=1 Tax=Sporosarcina cascadiensis TaxID=2660747 RepID=UPI00129C105E|nr:UDP-4-amino-4,6-dideoxy-N-acetyl-beta-L-altrosamine N-acetyltransferase [Sporosarcina cascadiensis]